MTPQERTELQRLAEQAKEMRLRAATDVTQAQITIRDAIRLGQNPGSVWVGLHLSAENVIRLIDAIAPLLSLTAECEELRADLEKERAEKEEEHKRFENAMRLGDKQAALTIKFRGERNAERESRRTPESRYSALEKAARHLNGDDEEEDGIQTRWDHYCSNGVGYCKAVSVSALEGLSDALDALPSKEAE